MRPRRRNPGAGPPRRPRAQPHHRGVQWLDRGAPARHRDASAVGARPVETGSLQDHEPHV